MAKIVKKRRKIRIEGFITLLFVCSVMAFFISFTYVRSQNVVLASKENQLENEIEVVKNDVANLELEVKKLDNRERILGVAKEAGLTINQEKIVSVTTGE